MGRGLIVALIVSVAINVFAIGFLSGKQIGGGAKPAEVARPDMHGVEIPFGFMRDVQSLPPQVRRKFRGKIREHIPAMRAHAVELRQSRRVLNDALTAKDWDRAAVEKALERMHAAQSRQRAVISAAFINAFETLSREERDALIEHARERRGKGRRQFRDRRDGVRGE